jgi:hypothetical protein
MTLKASSTSQRGWRLRGIFPGDGQADAAHLNQLIAQLLHTQTDTHEYSKPSDEEKVSDEESAELKQSHQEGDS